MRRIVLAVILTSTFAISGCSRLIDRDFRKATLVGELRLGSVEPFSRTVTLPAGDARLVLAVPNYQCAPIDDAAIEIIARTPNGILFSERILLSQLTWSHGEGSCNAYGYLENATDKRNATARHAEMRAKITSDQSLITVRVDTSSVRTPTERGASIWFVYGDRVPTRKLFGGL